MNNLSQEIQALQALLAEEKPTVQVVKTMQEISGQVTNALMQQGLAPAQCVATASAFLANMELLGFDMESDDHFVDKLQYDFDNVEIDAGSSELVMVEPTYCFTALENAKILCRDRDDRIIEGSTLEHIMSQINTKHFPTLASEELVRQKGYKVDESTLSPLALKACHALEETQMMRNEYMLSIARAVDAIEHKGHKMFDELIKLKQEEYVLAGVIKMEPDTPYISEYQFDTRKRMYQSALHGVSGSQGDRTRSLTDLSGVSKDYNPAAAIKLLVAEIKDMGSFDTKEDMMEQVRLCNNDPVAFVINNLGKTGKIGKAWSFCKASKLLIDLVGAMQGGEKPYIGMAFGLDAKCSGPQLGGFVVGDALMLQMCGFSRTKVDDAYQNALVHCRKKGFHGLTRTMIKHPFMGVFYGQGSMAFLSKEFIEENPEIGQIMFDLASTGERTIEQVAMDLHSSIEKSFGTKLMFIRELFKSHGYVYGKDEHGESFIHERTEGAISYKMVDGCTVTMDYKKELNIYGQQITPKCPSPSVEVKCGMMSMRFTTPSYISPVIDTAAYSRKGFVNFIQALDALVARMIVANLKDMGAQHIVSIHDCFRVNVHEMALLEEAIKLTYKELFASKCNTITENLPLGQDMLGLYFEGANKALKEGERPTNASMFFGDSGRRNLIKIGKECTEGLIDALGVTYYFAK